MFVAYLVQNVSDTRSWLKSYSLTTKYYLHLWIIKRSAVFSGLSVILNSWSRDPMWLLLRINALITVILAVYKNNAEIMKDYIKFLALHRMEINLCNLMLLTFDISNLFKPLQMSSRFHALKYQRSGCKDIKIYKL